MMHKDEIERKLIFKKITKKAPANRVSLPNLMIQIMRIR
jgi:hypothetical protein